MSRIQAVCFDLDDTLRDPGGARGAIRRTCERLGPLTQVDPAKLFAANGEVWQRLWPEVEDRWTYGSMTGEAVTTEAWRRTLQACGHHDPTTARRAAKIHLAHAFTAHRLFDDARILLDAIEHDAPAGRHSRRYRFTSRGHRASRGGLDAVVSRARAGRAGRS